jgi:hypothetical protein
MRISKLIQKLQKLQDMFGDVECVVAGYDNSRNGGRDPSGFNRAEGLTSLRLVGNNRFRSQYMRPQTNEEQEKSQHCVVITD